MSRSRSPTNKGSQRHTTVRGPGKPLKGHDGSAVAHPCGHRRVPQPGADDPARIGGAQFTDSFVELVPAREHVIGTQAGDEVAVLVRRVGDHCQPGGLGRLHRVTADGAGCAGHRDRRSGGGSSWASSAIRAVSAFIRRVDAASGRPPWARGPPIPGLRPRGDRRRRSHAFALTAICEASPAGDRSEASSGLVCPPRAEWRCVARSGVDLVARLEPVHRGSDAAGEARDVAPVRRGWTRPRAGSVCRVGTSSRTDVAPQVRCWRGA